MRKVAVLGIGQIPVDEHWEKSVRHLAGDAAITAIADAHFEPTAVESLYVGNMLSGSLNKQESLAALIADWVGLRGIEASKIEAACGSGAAAFRSGVMAVASGVNDLVLVVGVEKMTETGGTNTTSHLASAADANYEAAQGLSFVALNALIMRRYLHEFGWKHNDFAPFSINAHANGAKNPNTRLQEAITQKDYSRARMVADPINLLDASPIGDGAAAIVLCPAEKIRRNGQPIITVAASAAATDSIAVHDRFDAMRLAVAETSAQKAYAQANVTPNEIVFLNCTTLSRSWQRSRSKPAVLPNAVRVCGSV